MVTVPSDMTHDSPTAAPTDPVADLRFLAGSAARREILRTLAAETLQKRELWDDTGMARTTVYQNVEQLRDRGWIERTAGGYTTTWFGTIVVDEFLRYESRLECAGTLGPFLANVDVDAVDLDVLEDATVITAQPHDPNAPTNRTLEVLSGVDTFRVVQPYMLPTFVECAHVGVTEGDCEFAATLSGDNVDWLADEHAEELRTFVRNDAATLHRYDGDLPFGLVLTDETLMLLAYDEDSGSLCTLVETEAAEALAWGRERYESYTDAATLVEPGAVAAQ